MCLTIPKRVISIDRDFIKVRAGKKNQEVGTIISVKKGDWVLTQNSIITKKITAKQAEEIKQLLK
jgi:hydrogenase maturation factor